MLVKLTPNRINTFLKIDWKKLNFSSFVRGKLRWFTKTKKFWVKLDNEYKVEKWHKIVSLIFFMKGDFLFLFFFATKFSNSYHNERIDITKCSFFYLSVFLLTSFDFQLHLINSLKVGKCFLRVVFCSFFEQQGISCLLNNQHKTSLNVDRIRCNRRCRCTRRHCHWSGWRRGSVISKWQRMTSIVKKPSESKFIKSVWIFA